ncbi:MAG: hypothetical protein E7549_07895 [Ruminococcaceae bacterium]|nr:hypothetical protein [Oscillospiraceae bacterium]
MLSFPYSGRKGGVRMRKRRRVRWVLCIVLAVIVGTSLALDYAMRPLVREYAVNRARTVASEAMATAVEEVLSTTAHGDLTVVSRDADGAVLSIETDTAEVNRLSAQVVTALGAVLLREEYSALTVPLLNATGRVFLMGRGPKITMKLLQNGAATVRVVSAFSDAGINQTVHRLELDVTFRAVLLVAGMSEPIETNGNFLVTETVIVGTVPDRYVDFSGG